MMWGVSFAPDAIKTLYTMQLYLSPTNDLAHVCYRAEIVGWEDKRTMSEQRKQVINRLIHALQPGEVQPDGEGLYNASSAVGGNSVNLLHVWRMSLLDQPFSVERLRKISDGKPLSTGRTQSGGWSYVVREA